jgi:ubiquinone biosynthesis monooxygenase Coq7
MPIARTVFARFFAHARGRSLVTTAFNAEDGRSLETLSSAARKLASEFPAWLRTEMRTNHAGEYGAVLIYGGALRAAALRQEMGLETDNGRMREFAERHRAHEQAHLDIMMTLVPESNRSRLLPVWSVAAQSLGFFPALVGPRCLYWTVASVETFVEQHYDAQIARLRREGALPDVAALLERLCAEEVRAIATPACPVPPSSAPPREPRAALAGRAQG